MNHTYEVTDLSGVRFCCAWAPDWTGCVCATTAAESQPF